ncbi:hypothetical protein EDB87DRAFT_1581220 [Lactarius vividus]|nr:hypothetical protein EDB87DRAFT_1581220 [Lactarius vividus]
MIMIHLDPPPLQTPPPTRLVRALMEMVNIISPPASSATASNTDICTATMNMIKDEEGFSDNNFACAINCIVASAELAGTYIAIRSQGLRPWSPLIEMDTPDAPIAGIGTNENAFSHLAGAASDHFATRQALNWQSVLSFLHQLILQFLPSDHTSHSWREIYHNYIAMRSISILALLLLTFLAAASPIIDQDKREPAGTSNQGPAIDWKRSPLV